MKTMSALYWRHVRARSLYVLQVLWDHGLPVSSLQDMLRATVIAKLVYCAPAWSELCSANDRARLDTFLLRSKRYGYCADDIPAIIDLFAAADQWLFKRVINNEYMYYNVVAGKKQYGL